MQFCALYNSCGVAETAMEEPSATTEASPMRDVPPDVKCCIHECSCGSNRDNSLSMPVCFLVKEQAKSQVAIQDLQRRLNQVEVVQDDVIDAIIEFRNYLSDSKSYSFANHVTPSSLRAARSSVDAFSNLTPGSKFNECIVPSVVEVPPLIKTRTYSSRDYDLVYNIQTTTSEEQSQKQLDLIKNKEFVSESDKQDSGLDSDCREHNDIHPSINRNCRALDPESSDELLQLLDEISHRSEILQKQLAVAEEADDTKAKDSPSETAKDSSKEIQPDFKLGQSDAEHSQGRNHSTLQEDGNQKVPTTDSSFGKAGMMEAKSINVSKMSARKRIANSIDSATVSSILKETNIVDLQRQALIYLVDNAVLSAKMKETEQRLSSQQVESEKLESSLKDEARLLMMENRELRLCLDEQKLESSSMKSRMVMLERVLQSVTHENQELSWQLGESLNLQTLPKREMHHNLSASYGFDSSLKMPRRASMPSRFLQSEGPCAKSKLPSHSSSNLDLEESDGLYRPNGSFRNRSGTIYSSTPMVPFQKQKAFKAGFPGDGSPANFHSAKKCFKPYLSQDTSRVQKSDKFLEDSPPYRSGQDTRSKTVNFSRGNTEEALDNVGKFPFNSILEKLKQNSEFRLAKSASAKVNVSDSHSSSQGGALQENESPSQSKDSPLQSTNSDHALQKKKGRNIQQRIQNILDRIVAETEEAS